MHAKRIISFLLALLTACSLAGCKEPPENPEEPTGSVEGPEPEGKPFALVQDFAPEYLALTDVTEQIQSVVAAIPSTRIPEESSATEFTTQEQLAGYIAQYDDVGRTGDTQILLNEEGFCFTGYDNFRLEGGSNRYFFLANPAYSGHTVITQRGIVYNAETDALYVLLDYTNKIYADYEPNGYYQQAVRDTKTAYYVAALNLAAFTEPVEQILFVTPEERPITRTDIGYSVVGYDETYKALPFFDYANGGVAPVIYSFPSTQAAGEMQIQSVADANALTAYLDQYHDIVDRTEDTVIMAPGIVDYNHREAGLYNISEHALLNLFLAASELNSQKTLACAQFSFKLDWYTRYNCGQFYDEQTQTVYIYLSYGQNHTENEKFSDRALVEENSKGTYAILSVAFHADSLEKVKNVVIVLPEVKAE